MTDERPHRSTSAQARPDERRSGSIRRPLFDRGDRDTSQRSTGAHRSEELATGDAPDPAAQAGGAPPTDRAATGFGDERTTYRSSRSHADQGADPEGPPASAHQRPRPRPRPAPRRRSDSPGRERPEPPQSGTVSHSTVARGHSRSAQSPPAAPVQAQDPPPRARAAAPVQAHDTPIQARAAAPSEQARSAPAQSRATTRAAEAEPAPAPDRTGQGSHRRELRLALEMRVVGMIVRREMKRYFRSKAKILSSFVQPFFFLLIFGYGMRTLVKTTGGVSFEQFVFPGVVAMTVLGRALLSAVSIVQDREHGFLREMLVSPTSRISIVVGSIIGGASISTIQAVLLFLGAPIMGLFPGPGTIVTVLSVVGLMAVEVTALGVALATFIQRPHSFQAVTQAITYPMLVLSGALVPLAGLPSWVQTIARCNIFSYPVDAVRRLLIGSHVQSDEGSLTGMVVLGHQMSVSNEVMLTVFVTVLFVVVAAWRFARVS